jgi:hypothetical protein
MTGISIFFVIMPHTLVTNIDPVSTDMRPHAAFPGDWRLAVDESKDSLQGIETHPPMVNKHNALPFRKKWESIVDLMPRG